jgi:hypothetical protein
MELSMPYFSFCIALYAQWLESFSKLFTPAHDFTWVFDTVKPSGDTKPDSEART